MEDDWERPKSETISRFCHTPNVSVLRFFVPKTNTKW